MISQELDLHAQKVRSRLDNYMKKWNVSGRQIARYLKIHYNSVYHFMDGRRHTYGKTMKVIEEFLDRENNHHEMD